MMIVCPHSLELFLSSADNSFTSSTGCDLHCVGSSVSSCTQYIGVYGCSYVLSSLFSVEGGMLNIIYDMIP